jgi:hypothetical protein
MSKVAVMPWFPRRLLTSPTVACRQLWSRPRMIDYPCSRYRACTHARTHMLCRRRISVPTSRCTSLAKSARAPSKRTCAHRHTRQDQKNVACESVYMVHMHSHSLRFSPISFHFHHSCRSHNSTLLYSPITHYDFYAHAHQHIKSYSL